jgi:Ca-activated chloride channel family protein
MARRRTLLFSFTAIALLCSLALAAQSKSAVDKKKDAAKAKKVEPVKDDPEANFKISTDVEMVLLDVSVQDSKGGYVAHLPQSAFQVEENGVVQTIKSFANIDVPVEVGLIMDDSGSMRGRRQDVNSAGISFIGKSNPKDQIFVLNFNDTIRPGLPPDTPFTDNIDLLRTALSLGRPEGRTVLYDAIAAGLRHLDTGHSDKKTLVLVTDGGDNRSRIDLDEVMRLIEESHTTIYTVGLYDADDTYRNPGVLRRIANASGGECFLPKHSAEVIPICEKIANDIRNRYTIGYIPEHIPNASELRKVRVKATDPDHPHLIVKSRTEYRHRD